MPFTWYGSGGEDGLVWERKIIRRYVVPKISAVEKISTVTYEAETKLIVAGSRHRITKAEAKKIVREGTWHHRATYFDGNGVVSIIIPVRIGDFDLIEEVEVTQLRSKPMDPASLERKDY